MNAPKDNFDRFLSAQHQTYQTALNEIKDGRKTSHWMWQLQGLGHSEMANSYGIANVQEAQNYYAHPILRQRLIEISTAVLENETNTATQLMGSPDDLKLHSSMTLFSELSQTNPVFQKVLDKFFNVLFSEINIMGAINRFRLVKIKVVD